MANGCADGMLVCRVGRVLVLDGDLVLVASPRAWFSTFSFKCGTQDHALVWVGPVLCALGNACSRVTPKAKVATRFRERLQS